MKVAMKEDSMKNQRQAIPLKRKSLRRKRTKRVHRKDTKESKSFTEPSKSGEDITNERKQRKQRGKRTDETQGNKRSEIDGEIKPDKQEGDSSEGGDGRRQTEEPEAAQEGRGKRKMGTTERKPKNVFYSPPKKIPMPKPKKRVNRKGT